MRDWLWIVIVILFAAAVIVDVAQAEEPSVGVTGPGTAGDISPSPLTGMHLCGIPIALVENIEPGYEPLAGVVVVDGVWFWVIPEVS